MSEHAGGSASTRRHRHEAAQRGAVDVAVVTVSDSRTEQTDESGRYLREQVAQAGHRLVAYQLIPDDPARLQHVLVGLAATEAQAILFNGGTGLSARDTTYDALSGLLEKTLPGFGELFRMLSWQEIGAAAMLSRATAGTFRGKLVVSTPGSTAAVRLAWDKLIAPELRHLVWELSR